MAVQRLNLRGALLDADGEGLVAEISCLVVIRDLGRWQGSLTVLVEHISLWACWLDGRREYVMDLPGLGSGTVSIDPLEWLDPAARGSYTFRGLSLPPAPAEP